MPLDLQLHRIAALLKNLGNPHLNNWKSIHIAGTNGKGSVCSYLSHILTANKIRSGRFNSPHLISRNDSIQIDNVPIPLPLFLEYEKEVIQVDKEIGTQCTEFELLTATAFQIFKQEKVDVAVIEVGLGGRLDSTNVLEPEYELCTGITKIGMDHENLLGDNLGAIAFEKAGIIKTGVPCVVDGSNDLEVLKVIGERAHANQSELHEVKPQVESFGETLGNSNDYKSPLLGEYQLMNLNVALKIIQVISETSPYSFSKEKTQEGVRSVAWPGRLQSLELHYTRDGNVYSMPILLDGAHNTQAAIELGTYIDKNKRGVMGSSPVIYIIGVTQGKTITELFEKLVRPGDHVILTQFKEGIEGMPWIKPCETEVLYDQVKTLTENCVMRDKLEEAVQEADRLRQELNGSNVVVCGSLYLAADILRIDQAATGKC